jgi:hypothetical protein
VFFGNLDVWPLLPQFFFFSRRMGAVQGTGKFLNFSLTFSECRRQAVQKNASQSSGTVAVWRLILARFSYFPAAIRFSPFCRPD